MAAAHGDDNTMPASVRVRRVLTAVMVPHGLSLSVTDL